MTKLIALYRKPKDPQAFDRYYFSTHVPIANKTPGLRGYEVSDGAVTALEGESPYHLVALLSFDSMAALQHALTTPESQATAADLANFADGGVDLLMCETREVFTDGGGTGPGRAEQ